MFVPQSAHFDVPDFEANSAIISHYPTSSLKDLLDILESFRREIANQLQEVINAEYSSFISVFSTMDGCNQKLAAVKASFEFDNEQIQVMGEENNIFN